MIRFIRGNHTSPQTLYEVLQVPRNSSTKDIKLAFKKLSKAYHPDLHPSLNEEDKKHMSDKFISIVSAYETLKDKKRRQQYDLELSAAGAVGGMARYTPTDEAMGYSYNSTRNKDWHFRYGESRPNGARMDRTQHRVHNFSDFSDTNTTFTGRHKNYGDRHDVPHFDYNEHLLKNLKFEQRMISRRLTPEDKEAILKQITESGENITEELITKYLMRRVNSKSRDEVFKSVKIGDTSSHEHMYRGPTNAYRYDEDEASGFRMAFFLGGAAGSLMLAYKMLFG